MRCSPLTKDDLPPDDDTPCSGRGECQNGTCLCEIRYAGDECSGFNLPYHAGKLLDGNACSVNLNFIFFVLVIGVSSVFYFVALVSIIQLLICIVAEYQRLKQPSLLRACRITTQKLLYFVVFIAATLRGAYFTTPVSYINIKKNVPKFMGVHIFAGSDATGMGFEFSVSLLSIVDDMRISRCLSLG